MLAYGRVVRAVIFTMCAAKLFKKHEPLDNWFLIFLVNFSLSPMIKLKLLF